MESSNTNIREIDISAQFSYLSGGNDDIVVSVNELRNAESLISTQTYIQAPKLNLLSANATLLCDVTNNGELEFCTGDSVGNVEVWRMGVGDDAKAKSANKMPKIIARSRFVGSISSVSYGEIDNGGVDYNGVAAKEQCLLAVSIEGVAALYKFDQEKGLLPFIHARTPINTASATIFPSGPGIGLAGCVVVGTLDRVLLVYEIRRALSPSTPPTSPSTSNAYLHQIATYVLVSPIQHMLNCFDHEGNAIVVVGQQGGKFAILEGSGRCFVLPHPALCVMKRMEEEEGEDVGEGVGEPSVSLSSNRDHAHTHAHGEGMATLLGGNFMLDIDNNDIDIEIEFDCLDENVSVLQKIKEKNTGSIGLVVASSGGEVYFLRLSSTCRCGNREFGGCKHNYRNASASNADANKDEDDSIPSTLSSQNQGQSQNTSAASAAAASIPYCVETLASIKLNHRLLCLKQLKIDLESDSNSKSNSVNSNSNNNINARKYVIGASRDGVVYMMKLKLKVKVKEKGRGKGRGRGKVQEEWSIHTVKFRIGENVSISGFAAGFLSTKMETESTEMERERETMEDRKNKLKDMHVQVDKEKGLSLSVPSLIVVTGNGNSILIQNFISQIPFFETRWVGCECEGKGKHVDPDPSVVDRLLYHTARS